MCGRREYRGADKLKGKAAVIAGGDSGIGRAVAVLFAKEGADVAILYLHEHEDAKETRRQVEREGRRSITIARDIGDPKWRRYRQWVDEARTQKHHCARVSGADMLNDVEVPHGFAETRTVY